MLSIFRTHEVVCLYFEPPISCHNPDEYLCGAQEHTTCVSEHDKYAKGATKPGGYAAQGFYGSGEKAKAEAPGAPAGLEFLATHAPWKCSICNVTCTSSETLMGHAAGAKHKRRVSSDGCTSPGYTALYLAYFCLTSIMSLRSAEHRLQNHSIILLKANTA